MIIFRLGVGTPFEYWIIASEYGKKVKRMA